LAVLLLLQNCYYVPPSLRTRATVCRTPPSTGASGYIEQKSGRKYTGPGTLPNAKTISPKSHVAFTGTVQRKLEMDSKDFNKNEKSTQSSVKQPKYRPPARNSSCKLLNHAVLCMDLSLLVNRHLCWSVGPFGRLAKESRRLIRVIALWGFR